MSWVFIRNCLRRLQVEIVQAANVDIKFFRRGSGMGIGVNAAMPAEKMLRDLVVELVELKVVLALEHRELPATVHLNQLNGHIRFLCAAK